MKKVTEALRLLLSDNETRGAQGQQVNWALIHQGHEALNTLDAEMLAQEFHANYERLAPALSYQTRAESAKPWSELPENNRRLMVAVCREMLQ